MTLMSKATEGAPSNGRRSPEANATDDVVPEAEAAALRRHVGRRKRRKLLIWSLRVALIVLLLTTWELFAGKAKDGPWVLIDEYFVSQPSDVVTALREWVDNGVLVADIMYTAKVTTAGLVMGLAAGLLVGFLLGVNQMLGAVLSPFVAAVYSIPRLALIPLFLLWFGLGIATNLVMVTVMVFFIIFYNTYSGVRDVDQRLIDSLRLMGASRWRIYRVVSLPSAAVWIVTGLRVAVPYALVGAVTSEMLTSNSGMGYLVMRAAGQFYTAGVFAAIIVLMAMSAVLAGVVSLIERWALRWRDAGGASKA